MGEFLLVLPGQTDIVEQSATSHYLSHRTFILVRISLLALLWYGFVLQVAENIYSFVFVTYWSYTLFLISYSALTAISLLHIKKRESSISVFLARLTVPLHFVSATAALYVVPVYYIILKPVIPELVDFIAHGGTLIVHLLDIIAGAKYQFRSRYIILTLVYFLIYITFTWSRYALFHHNPHFFFPYAFLHPKNSSSFVLVFIHLALIGWCLVASSFTIISSFIYKSSSSTPPTPPHHA